MTASKDDVKKGPPLTCILCKGVLLLNAEGLKMHLGSKRHKKQQKRLEDSEQDTIVYAEDLQEDSSGVFFCLPAQRLPRTGLLGRRCRVPAYRHACIDDSLLASRTSYIAAKYPFAVPGPALPCPALPYSLLHPTHESLNLSRDELKPK